MTAKNRGIPAHEPTKQTRELVSLHATVGTTQSVIADLLDIDDKTLRKYYRKELNQSLAKANATIGGHLFNKAKNGDTTAQIFWLKTRAQWSEKKEFDLTSSDGSMSPKKLDDFYKE
jgi:hypothetical protein